MAPYVRHRKFHLAWRYICKLCNIADVFYELFRSYADVVSQYGRIVVAKLLWKTLDELFFDVH